MTTDHAGWTGYHLNVRSRPDPSTAPVNGVLVALDGSAYAERSLEVADVLAAAAGLPLRLLMVRPSAEERSSAESYLARAARRAPRVSDVVVRITADVGAPLVTAADEGELVVLATHARHAVGEVLFGSIADRVLKDTTRPVLLVGPDAGVPDPTFERMLLPDDGGQGARRLRPFAQAWARHLQSVPWVVQVLSDQEGGLSMDVLEAAHVEDVAKGLGSGAQWEVLHGKDPAEEIVAFAVDHRVGLIAVSVPARHRIGPDVVGGVALEVVRHARCPVLAFGRVEHELVSSAAATMGR